jgi:hypothetical protein
VIGLPSFGAVYGKHLHDAASPQMWGYTTEFRASFAAVKHGRDAVSHEVAVRHAQEDVGMCEDHDALGSAGCEEQSPDLFQKEFEQILFFSIGPHSRPLLWGGAGVRAHEDRISVSDVVLRDGIGHVNYEAV